MIRIYICKWVSFNSLNLMHKHKIKYRIIGVMHRGLLGKNITKLDFHHDGMIIKSPSASATLDDSTIQHRSYYEIRGCNTGT